MFKLSPRFLEKYEGKQPNWGFGDLSYFTYKRTYARMKADGTQEEFFDTCRRVTEGVFSTQKRHCKTNRLPWNAHKAQKTAQEFFTRMWQFKFSPPGRGFWIMGTEMVEKVGSAALNNCGFTSTKDINIELGNSFSWAMDMLMLGVGVGFDACGAGTVIIKGPRKDPIGYAIPDTREGWVESVRLLLNSYQSGGHVIKFDYSKIRPKGAPIKGFGGVASGPDPLRVLHENIRKTLDALIGESITSVAIVDLMNFVGKCVVAGNVRRSAELAIGEIDDAEYIGMKDYNRYAEELRDRRWASNNSVFARADSDFSSVAPGIALNGEPGLIFLDNARHFGRMKDGFHPFESDHYDNVDGFNPCAEQGLEDKELCCLVETYPANHETAEDYLVTLKFAYMYAKTVTLIPTHDYRTNSVMMRNRRIGCSMSGIQQAVGKWGLAAFLKQFCDLGYETIKKWDRIYSKWLGIPRSIKMTTVKPSGTVSLLAGATPGVHCTHSEYYYRTVRLPGNSPLLAKLLEAGYRVEPNFNERNLLIKALTSPDNADWSPGDIELYADDMIAGRVQDAFTLHSFGQAGGTVVAYFPVKERNFTKSKFDISLWEQLALVREMQHYWSDNAVSCTVTVREHERNDLERAIEFSAPYVKTLSFLPLTNHKYAQAPYQECSREEYENYVKKLKSLDLSAAAESSIKGSKFCSNDTCDV
jgi:ribonucleoside-triphosphate reductase (thioredoxin)